MVGGKFYLVWTDAGPLPQVTGEREEKTLLCHYFSFDFTGFCEIYSAMEDSAKKQVQKLLKIRKERELRDRPEKFYPKNFKLVFESDDEFE